MKKRYRFINLALLTFLITIFFAGQFETSARVKPIVKTIEKVLAKYGDDGAEIAVRITRKFSDDAAPDQRQIFFSLNDN